MTDNKAIRKLSDYFPPEKPFYPEADEISLDALQDVPIVILETKLMPKFKNDFGDPKDMFFIAFRFVGEEEPAVHRTVTSAYLPVEKLKEANRKKAFPAECTFKKIQGKENTYWKLE